MKNYDSVKKELSMRCSSTKHFTKKFYADFLKAKGLVEKAVQDGTLEQYRYIKKINGTEIILNHLYDDIYASKFYNRNSCAYCEFLSIVF